MTENNPNNQYLGDFTGVGRDINTGGGDVKITFVSQQPENVILNQRLITGSPYLGLFKFEEGDKDKFFGRDIAIL